MAKPNDPSTNRRPAKPTSIVQGGPAAPAWHATPGTFIAGQEEIDSLDLVAIDMERKWGAGRLRLLVPQDLREKFDRQRYLTNQAIWHGDLEGVRRECKRMTSAWKALDRAAEAAGAECAPPEVWEAAGNAGVVYALVRASGDVSRIQPSGRHVAVYSLDEIATLLDGYPAIVKAKEVFPGAAVEYVRRHIGDPLDGIADTLSPIDEMPF
jgi:hypothetical protein